MKRTFNNSQIFEKERDIICIITLQEKGEGNNILHEHTLFLRGYYRVQMKFVQFFLKPKNPNFATTLREMIRKYVWFESKKRMPLKALKKRC